MLGPVQRLIRHRSIKLVVFLVSVQLPSVRQTIQQWSELCVSQDEPEYLIEAGEEALRVMGMSN